MLLSCGDRMVLAPAYFPTAPAAVSSALERFTAVFGMGTGGTTPLSPPRPSGRCTRRAGIDGSSLSRQSVRTEVYATVGAVGPI